MAKNKHVSRPVELNLTSMMDVTFLLIIFFLLVNRMSSAQLPKLDAPEPVGSKALDLPERDVVIVNVVPDGEGAELAKSVMVGIREIPPASYNELTELLKVETAKSPLVEVDLRADKNLRYAEVQPVMKAITNAGITKVNLVAKVIKD